MLFRKLGLWVVMIGAGIGFTAASACGGSSTSSNNGGSGGQGGTAGTAGTAGTGGGTPDASAGAGGGGQTCGPNVKCDLPPPAPSGPAANGTSPTVFAVKHLYLGDVGPDGGATTSGWQDYGYNLDNLISSATSTNHCQLQPGADPTVTKQDGPGGLDNSFGHCLVPTISSLISSPSQTVDQQIASGAFTLLIDLKNLGSGATETGVQGGLYAGENLGHAPAWDGTDAWPVAPELLNAGADGGPNESSPKVSFQNSYITNNTWVSGSNATVDLSLNIQGQSLAITINDAVITMDVSQDRKSATNGIIAGVINTQELLNQLRQIAGSIGGTSFCGGSTFNGIAQLVTNCDDIMSDGTNGNPAKTCDGISIGIGFDAYAAQLGPIAPPAQPKPNPCADAGP